MTVLVEKILSEYSPESIKRVFELFNEMENSGVVSSYALGGATAANLYVDPMNTLDLDFFVLVQQSKSLDFLKPITEFFRSKGYEFSEDGYFVIEGNLIQVLPAEGTEVSKAAVEDRVFDGSLGGFVFSPEYVVADAVLHSSFSRADKFKFRVELFLKNKAVDFEGLERILEKLGLKEKFERLFGNVKG
jgi:hypothetical protein